MQVKSKVTINQRKMKQLSAAAVIALEHTAEELHAEVVRAGVVPRRDGALEGEQFFVDYTKVRQNKVSLVHSTPYARRMYYHPEYKFHKEPWTDEKGRKHDGNPNARGKWFEPWINGEKKDFCKEAFEEFYKKAGGL